MVVVELGQRRRGEDDEEKEKEKEKATNIKSNNPRLAGGEKHIWDVDSNPDALNFVPYVSRSIAQEPSLEKFFAILEANWTEAPAAAVPPPAAPVAPVADAAPSDTVSGAADSPAAPVPPAVPDSAASSLPAASAVEPAAAMASDDGYPAPSSLEDFGAGTELDSPSCSAINISDDDALGSTPELPSDSMYFESQPDHSMDPPSTPKQEDSMPPPSVPEKKRSAYEETMNPFAPGLSREETEHRVRARILAIQCPGFLYKDDS